MWNQYSDSMGGKFVHETKTKHDMDKISVKDNTKMQYSHTVICVIFIQSM